MRYTIVLLLLFSFASNAQNKSIVLAGENYLILNGGKFNNKKFVFTKADGDWFATTSDAHASLLLYSSFDTRELQFNVEWDGKNESHLINDVIRHDGKRTGEFTITAPDKDVYGDGLNIYPSDNKGVPEEVKITVVAIDELNVQAKISGTVSNNNEHMQVSGMISLKKNSPTKKAITDAYKDCDNVIHDKLVGGEFRSPTDCEIKFDLDLRNALHLSFQPLIDSLLKKGWQLENESPVKPIMGTARGSEKNYFNPGFTDGGNYEINLMMDPASGEYKKWQSSYNDMMQELQKNPTKAGVMDQLVNFTASMKAATHISIHVSVNFSSSEIDNFTTNHRVDKPAKIAYVIYLKNAQSPNGGGKEDSRNTVFVYFGRWGYPKFINNGDGSERVNLASTLSNFASHLSVQTMQLRMECSDELAAEILKDADIEKLASLVNH
jgi:hypothetical protein